ncbi:hypothetical protein OROHE_027085 [Orobanche hederae]
MGLLLFLLFALLLSGTSPVRLNQEAKHPALKLPLYHIRHQHSDSNSLQTTPSFSETLNLDDARVKFLISRLITNKKYPTPTHPSRLIGGKPIRAPLKPGESIGVANYYTEIGIGTPATNHSVIVDTGSSFSWIQCEPCAVYCHPQTGSRFNPSSSSTYQNLSCSTIQCRSLLEKATLNSPMCTSPDTCLYTATYGDQSFSVGYLGRDSLTFGPGSLPGFVFGCGQDNNGFFGKSEGLVGLARDELSMLSQLSARYGKCFAYCLPTASPFGKIGTGGFLSIGISSNPAYKFTPMLSDSRDPALYFINMTGITVAGRPLGLPSSDYNVPTIIDSGTTIPRLATPVYSALRSVLVKIISSKYKPTEAFSILDACFVGNFDEISAIRGGAGGGGCPGGSTDPDGRPELQGKGVRGGFDRGFLQIISIR